MQLTLFGILLLFQVFQSKPEHSILNRDGQNFDSYFFGASISKIIQDQDGLIWLGTNNGVISYDGYESNHYTESLLDTASQGFQGDYVNALFEDSHGNIWVATAYGTFNVLPENSTSFINALATHEEPINSIRSITELENGDILSVSNIGFHLSNYDPVSNSITHKIIKYESVGIEDPINNAHLTSKGEILLLNDGLYKATISNDFEIQIEQLVEGENIWHIIDLEPDIHLYHDKEDLFVRLSDGKIIELDVGIRSGNRVLAIHKDSKGKVWVGTDKLLISFQLSSDYQVQELRIFQIRNTRSILEDQSGNLFFGNQFGVIKLNWNYTDYSYIDLPEKYGNTYTYKFHTDIDGNYWVGHANGFLKYITATGEFIEILGNSVHSINEDQDYNIWAADREGIKIYNPSTNELIKDFQNGHSYSIRFQENGDAWFVSKGSIKRIRYGVNKIEEVPIEANIRGFYINGNDLWLHADEFNLRKYQIADTGLVKIQEYLTDKPEYRFNWIEDDLQGNLWMSSNNGVLIVNKESGKIVSILNRENKLNADAVFEIIRDQSGIIWVKTSSFGSTAIDPKTFEAVSFTPSWLTQPNSRGYYCVNAVGRNGELFTDGRGGFFVFHPESIKKSEITPTISLLNTRVNDLDFEPNLSSLKHFQNDIDFEFTGIQFNNSDRNEFAYYLDGYDESWNYVGNQRSAQYLSLPPGNYTYFVKASNSDLVWSEPVALASFRILPAWWANPIAYFLYIVVIGFIGFRFYKVQLNKKVAESEANRLKEVDEFKTRFFTNISHEFRTPLTVIMGLADRIQHESTPIIKRNASKLLELINQILELSKVEANQASLKLEQFDFIRYVNYSVESLSTLANERGIGLTVKTEFDELFVELDQQKVDLILHNLLSNALKFTEREGQVVVRVKKESEKLVFSVSDTGIGIKKEALAHIFNRFFQTDLDNHRYEGTGIGLALTNELVHLMGGSIIVESEFGIGSTFAVTIPCTFVEAQDVVDQKTDKLIKTAQKITSSEDAEVILLVEDNYDVRSFIRQVLADEYKVMVAHNGEEGIKQATEEIPDIILTDVMMPYKDGFELTEELKEDVRTSHIPIIMLTAKADVESRISGLKTGADVYLGKPFNEDELKVHIQNLISLRNSIQKRFGGEINIRELGESQEDEFVKKIHSIILENLDDDTFGIEEVCKALAVSRTQLHRKLKALTGKSTSIFIRDIRLVEAKKMLLSTKLTISEIAYSVGFNDPNYFTKLYSEKFSHSPTKEREMVS